MSDRAHNAAWAWLTAGAVAASIVWASGCGGTAGRTEAVAGSPRAETPGSARALLREAIGVVSGRAMGADGIAWEPVWTELSAGLPAEGEPEAAHAAIGEVVRRLGDRHASFVPAVKQAAAEAPPASNAGATAPSTTPVIPDVPVGRVLADGVGYLLMPGCSAGDVEGLRRYARAARGEIARLSEAGARGWVIDLRLNGGGNLWPMLLGAAPLLGEGPVMATVRDGKGEIESRYGVTREHGAWIDWGRGFETQLALVDGVAERSWEPRGRAEPIAVVLGPWTMSSGEALAIAMASSRGAKTFGEPTAGLTTITNVFPLSDGSMLILPVSQMAGVDGKVVSGRMTPDVVVEFSGWPEAGDGASEAARRWVAERINTSSGAGGAGGGG